MRFTPSFLDEIRARLSVSEIVGAKVKLRRQGREYAGLSPFNAEKTPSFFVNDQKGFYHCFSSGKHGDIFRFLMETEGLSFPEAVERLAGQAGLAMPKADPREAARERERASLIDVMVLAADFFQGALAGREGGRARDYLERRGIGRDMQDLFAIGYAPASRHALREHLAGKGVDVAQMAEAGLVIAGPDVPVAYDRFRDRVIFPIHDLRGRVIAFGGRALSPDVPAKYLNSPETPLFHKGDVLFNAHRARPLAQEKSGLVAVEGYVDVIACTMAGFGNAVAPLGTALTEAQLALMWRMTTEPVLCFDGDGAGLRAAYRTVETALPAIEPGRSVRFALMPQGRDPDDLVREGGAEALAAVLGAAEPLVEMLWRRETADLAQATPERRAGIEAALKARIGEIRHEAVRRHYAQEFGRRLKAALQPERDAGRRSERGAARRGAKTSQPHASPRAKADEVSQSLRRSGLLSRMASRFSEREAVLVGTMLNHPRLVPEHAETFAEIEFVSPELDSLRQRIIEHAAVTESGHDELRERLARDGFTRVIERLDGVLLGRGLWQAQPEAADRDAEMGWIQALTLQRKSGTLHKDLRAAEAAFSRDASEANWIRLRELREELSSVDGNEAAIEGFGAESGRNTRSI